MEPGTEPLSGRQLHRELPMSTVVLGGPEITPHNEFLLSHGEFDVGVVGRVNTYGIACSNPFPTCLTCQVCSRKGDTGVVFHRYRTESTFCQRSAFSVPIRMPRFPSGQNPLARNRQRLRPSVRVLSLPQAVQKLEPFHWIALRRR